MTGKARTTSRARAKPRAKVEKIHASELAYHRAVVEKMQQAAVAEQQIAQLQEVVNSARAAFVSWGTHLHEKYGLGPTDNVHEDGRITRAPAPPDDA